jgi:hypothetical protein
MFARTRALEMAAHFAQPLGITSEAQAIKAAKAFYAYLKGD